MEENFIKAYEKYADALFRYFYYRVADRERAKDCMQETYTRTWAYLAEGKTVDNIRAFLYQVARNLIIDASRKKEPLSLEVIDPDGNKIKDKGDLRASSESSLDAQAALVKINELEEVYRETLTLRYVDGLRPKEIAAVLEETENVISVRIHRGLKQLRGLLKS